MNQNVKFNNILNECLDRLLQGETVEQCLSRYPEQAAELEPLLRTAVVAKIASTIQPRSEFTARARYQFQSALRDMEAKKSRRKSFFSWGWQWQSGWAIALMVIVLVVMGGGGTVAAASSSMPDNTLYSVKLATEQVQLAVTPSEIGKAELNARFAERRTEEIVYMASKGDVQEVRIIAQRLNTNMQNMTSLAASNEVTGGGASGGGTFGNNSAPPNPVEPPSVTGFAAPASSGYSQTSPPAITSPSLTAAAPATRLPSKTIPTPFSTASVPAAGIAPLDSSAENSDLHNQDTSNSNKAKIRIAEREKLRQIIIKTFKARQDRLEKAFQEASPSVRPAIRQAIAQSQSEYEKALRNLALAENNDH